MVLFSELPLNDELADELGELKIDFAFQPIFVVYFILSKYIVAGVALGGVKE